MAWPSSARVVKSTAALLPRFERALTDTMMPNFIPFILNRPTGGSGCNIENSGATVAINDLLASVHGHGANASLRILPGGWPQGEHVSFSDIRVRGAFTVSASAVGTGTGVSLTSAVAVKSLAGNPLTIYWAGLGESGEPVVHTRNGSLIAVHPVGHEKYQFQTDLGSLYLVSSRSTATLI